MRWRHFSRFLVSPSLRWAFHALVFLLAICAAESCFGALFYKVEKAVNLTDLNPGADGSVPMSVTGLNNSGRMIGYFPSSNGNKLHAFVWDDAAQVFTDLNAQLSADSSMATCVSDNGTVAGIYWDAITYAQTGFVLHPDGSIDAFNAADGGTGAIMSVTAINPAGDIIGSYVARDGSTRGYIIEQSAEGATISDLGDPEPDVTFNKFIWPVALNPSDQVAGNVYWRGERQTGEILFTEGFLWDGESASVLDASDLSDEWENVGINASGNVVGLYAYGARTLTGDPFMISGSYFWDGENDADLGDLGGGSGANVFALTDDGTAIGTSTGADGSLHLFSWNAASQTMNDLGGVSLYSGDNSFQPTSLGLPNGVPTGGNPLVFDLAGFGSDANGNSISLLWKGGSINSVIGLLPSYLSFTTVSDAYGSEVLVNHAEQIACAGTDISGNQMALLLSIDPDTDNDGLPDSWEMQYFGHLGVDLNAPAPGQSGLTNGQAYQQGIDPTGYNNQTPTFSVFSGDQQTGPPGGFVPAPLIVAVMDGSGKPLLNAPVIFTVTQGGGQVQQSSLGSPGTSITVLTDYNGQATAFFQLPNVQNNASTIVATPDSSVCPTTATFTEYSDGGTGIYASPFAPTNFVSQGNPDGSLDMSWTNHTDDQTPITVEIQQPDGSWQTVATLPPGTTSYHWGGSQAP